VFALLSAAGGQNGPLDTDSAIRGLSRSQPFIALLLAVCLFSLTGLPPTAGFIGKLNLFLAAWSDSTPVGRGIIVGRWLAMLLAANAAISAYYYLRLVALMFLEPAEQTESKPVHVGWTPWLAGIICAAATIAIFVAPQWLWDSIG
jgi:NADH-quinone oxidoreductase subunit N